ncbi:MAG: tRNA-(ms[2]io[6]A)-hydroxylase [Bacteroidia bacterium]
MLNTPKMKYSVELASDSPQAWVDTVLADFDSFLQDHADCERKASAMAMNMVARYSDRLEIIPELIETALEELEHFRDVYEIMQKRGVELPKVMEKDPYITQLMQEAKGGDANSRFLTHLLLGSVIECRGCERFRLVSEQLEDEELSRFYKILWAVEAKHGNIYVEMALNYFDKDLVYGKLDELMQKEAKIVANLPLRAALH